MICHQGAPDGSRRICGQQYPDPKAMDAHIMRDYGIRNFSPFKHVAVDSEYGQALLRAVEGGANQ